MCVCLLVASLGLFKTRKPSTAENALRSTLQGNARHSATSARSATSPTTPQTQRSAKISLQPEPSDPAEDAGREDSEAEEAEAKAEVEDPADHPT